MKPMHKQSKDENFPVGSILLDKKHRKLVKKYYHFARYADDIADNSRLSMKEKFSQLDELEDILYERIAYKGQKLLFVRELRQEFIKENLSFTLLTDLLTAFRQDAKEYKYETWGQLVEYCCWSAAPVGRFMLALHDENPATFLPATSLCVALQIQNHLQDLKKDAKFLKRVYIPSEMLKEFGVTPKDLLRPCETPELKKLKAAILCRVRGLIQEAELLPRIIKNLRLRMEVGVILSLTNIMVKRLESGDVLLNEIKFSKFDWIYAGLAGVTKSLFTKPKTLTTKGL